ncbi:MAG: InlB B-repeat-containing protein [Bifidobacterium subtile]|nr:InlB B-repeat-containing protein [Bifidobacterium subtile]
MKPIAVTFDANGGTFSDGTSAQENDIKPDSKYVLPPNPSRVGYSFDGWYAKAVGGSKLDGSATAPGNVDSQTFYAHWAANSVAVTFDANGGAFSNGTSSQKLTSTFGKPYTLPANPTRAGYSFAGWYTAKDDFWPGNQITASSVVSDVSDQTLYAHWDVQPVDVSFDANGGKFSDGSGLQKRTMTLNEWYDLPENPSRIGYSFNGWYTAKSGGTQVDAFTTVTATSSRALYAHWSANSAVVVFNANGGNFSDGALIQMTNQKFGDAYSLPSAPSQTGYTFNGWFTDESGGSKITASTKVSSVDAQTLYAQWVENKPKPVPSVTITFDANGGKFADGSASQRVSAKQGAKYALAKAPLRSGYSFSGWFTAKSGGSKVTGTPAATGSLTLYAQWKAVPQAKVATAFSAAGSSSVTASSASVSATLKDSAGKPVAGAAVTFATADGKVSASVKTSAFGVAKTTLTGLKAATKYSVGAKYAGDATHSASTLGSPIAFTTKPAPKPVSKGVPVPVYRVYNHYSGLHHYTTSLVEKNKLVKLGWKYEGVSFKAARQGSASGLKPVYREYNPYSGNHNWTLNQAEHNRLVKLGWRSEGVAWYANPAGPVTVYRLYNPYSGEHVYTTSAKEYAAVGKAGWHKEGTAWKGL